MNRAPPVANIHRIEAAETSMKIAVVGLGAVGGLMAGRLSGAGHDVSALARGATLDAVRRDGLRVQSGGAESSHPLVASDDATALGSQDLVVVAVKGPALAAAVTAMQPLLGPDTSSCPP